LVVRFTDNDTALEALIVTLRAHLTRLTEELSSHQHFLTELRSLRESDSRALKDKSIEVDKLREQVERLAGEVEVLRGVVEEGLKERRLVREQHSQSHVSGEDAAVQDHSESREAEVSDGDVEENDPVTMESEGEDDRERPLSPPLVSASRRNGSFHNQTMRTDYATLGSSNLVGTTTRPFIDCETLERISIEVEERRSDHSGPALSPPRSQQHSHSRSPSSIHSRPLSPNTEGMSGPISPSLSGPAKGTSDPPPSSRLPASTPAQIRGEHHPNRALPLEQGVETPFPQIRGRHLERLFFSAPEHNVKTCTMCCRRRPPGPPSAEAQTAFWFTKKEPDFRPRVQNACADDDEGFVEGSEADHDHLPPSAKSKGKQRQQMEFATGPSLRKQRPETGILPPQTVLARVLRELEDDFTHYKAFVP